VELHEFVSQRRWIVAAEKETLLQDYKANGRFARGHPELLICLWKGNYIS